MNRGDLPAKKPESAKSMENLNSLAERNSEGKGKLMDVGNIENRSGVRVVWVAIRMCANHITRC